ncbi:MAG TPA: hypothetical protein VGL44_16655 [Gaiellales bacterium]|jgi:hypothetical protein
MNLRAALRSPVAVWTGLAAIVVLTAGQIVLNDLTHGSWTIAAPLIAIMLPFVGVGALVALRRPENPLGWILMGIIGLFLLSTDGGAYGQLVYQHHRHWPAGPVSLFLEPLWVASLIVLPPIAILLFPEGRVPTRFLRWMLAVYLAAVVVEMLSEWALVARAIIDDNIHLVPDGDLTAINSPPAWFSAVQGLSIAFVAASAVVWVGVQSVRWRRATGEQRQQVKWLIGGAAIALFSLGFLLFGPGTSSDGAVQVAVSVALPIGLAALPVSIGVGILRYRLYEIDVIVRKTLVYAALAGSLAIVYLGGISLIDRALQAVTGQSGALAVTASTLAVAAAFQPLRSRIQRAVDHRFYRAKYDAAQTLESFAGRLRSQIELDALTADVLGVVRLTLQPRQASLWLRPAERRSDDMRAG